MTSYEKLVKYLVENVQAGLSPLKDITMNQEVIIVQNKQIITLLENIRSNSAFTIEEVEEATRSILGTDTNE